MNAAYSQTNPISHVTLSKFVEKTATEFGIPGVAVGVWADGREIYACHGVTSITNPLPAIRHRAGAYLAGDLRRIEQMESDHVICHTRSTDLTVDDMDGLPPGPESLQ
jgi:hypothetical protein